MFDFLVWIAAVGFYACLAAGVIGLLIFTIAVVRRAVHEWRQDRRR